MSETSSDQYDSVTGIIFDDRMKNHACLTESNMLEHPQRYLASLEKLKEYQLIDRCKMLIPKLASEEQVQLVHSKDYIKIIKNSSFLENLIDFKLLADKFDSTFFNAFTYESALLAVGCSIELVSAVLKEEVTNGLALVRPPGHHALSDQACGNCVFNNVAIAAKHAIQNFNIQKLIIIDWDVHHGQGTQQIFYDDPRVLYMSIHRYEKGMFWPSLRESNFDFVGGPSAEGLNVNVPLNTTELGNSEYISIFCNILLPIVHEFNPELILISSGYDAAIGCPEGEMKCTPPVYAHFIKLLSSLARGKIAVFIEGGYCIPSLVESVAFTVKGLLGDPGPSIPPCVKVNESLIESILNVVTVHRHFWKSVILHDIYDLNFGEDKHEMKAEYIENPHKYIKEHKIAGSNKKKSQSFNMQIAAEIQDLISELDLDIPVNRTGFTFEPREALVCSNEPQVESAMSAIAFYNKLKESKLLLKCSYIQPSHYSDIEHKVITDFLNIIEFSKTFDPEICRNLDTEFEMVQFFQKHTVSIPETYERLLKLFEAVLKRKCINGFAITRPAGYYINKGKFPNYVFDSAIVGAKYLLAKHEVKKIFLVDISFNRNESLQNYFFDNEKVVVVSLYHLKDTYSLSLKGDENQIGSDDAKGSNVNIPFTHSMCDGDILAALLHVILPVGYEFCPEFTIVSMGYDGSEIGLSPSILAITIKLLSTLSNGKIIIIWEKNLTDESAPDAAAHCLSALLNVPIKQVMSLKPCVHGISTIKKVVKIQKQYWKSLAFSKQP